MHDDDDDDNDWTLSDGTPLSRLTMNTPLEVRDGGEIRYRLAYFIRTDFVGGLPSVRVDIPDYPRPRSFPLNFTRLYKGDKNGSAT